MWLLFGDFLNSLLQRGRTKIVEKLKSSHLQMSDPITMHNGPIQFPFYREYASLFSNVCGKNE